MIVLQNLHRIAYQSKDFGESEWLSGIGKTLWSLWYCRSIRELEKVGVFRLDVHLNVTEVLISCSFRLRLGNQANFLAETVASGICT